VLVPKAIVEGLFIIRRSVVNSEYSIGRRPDSATRARPARAIVDHPSPTLSGRAAARVALPHGILARDNSATRHQWSELESSPYGNENMAPTSTGRACPSAAGPAPARASGKCTGPVQSEVRSQLPRKNQRVSHSNDRSPRRNAAGAAQYAAVVGYDGPSAGIGINALITHRI